MRFSFSSVAVIGLWGLLLWNSLDALIHHASVPGFPNAEQIEFLVVWPCVVISIGMAVLICSLFNKLVVIGRAANVLMLAALLPYLFFYSGGV